MTDDDLKLVASIDLAAELIAVALREERLSVTLRAFGAALHDLACDAHVDLEAALAVVVSEARAIEQFNKGEGLQ
jgi:hypothetical protein